MRRAAKRDTVEPEIVNALVAVGCKVYRSLPSDLLIHRASWGRGWFRVQEAKSTKYRDKRRVDQQKFLEDTGAAIVRSVEDSLRDINL